MIQNIVFDMGNVLISYDTRRFVRTFIEDAKDQQLVQDELFASAEWIRMDRGNITRSQVEQAVCERLPQHLHAVIPVLLDNWHKDIPPFPEMEILIKELHAKGYGIYLLSNTCKEYHDFRCNLPAIDLFDGEFASCDYGLLKPNVQIFEVFCARFNLAPETCFFIDDSPPNIEGALHAGMSGFIYRRNMEKLRNALIGAGVTCESTTPLADSVLTRR